ncbi:major facilitator superfamily domain-containing protein [Crassisporium funariophilum]|nr:major facilitator superfamily domain-containing protein [Crassisporium funariophilum]
MSRARVTEDATISGQDSDYLQSTCDRLLEDNADDSGYDRFEPAEDVDLLGQSLDVPEGLETIRVSSDLRTRQSRQRRAFFIRSSALICACSLSIGSHYATNILGPLKTRLQLELGTSHTEFGLLFSAYSLNSTWTPLVGGLLASRLGTTLTSILATGIILLGQILLLCGVTYGNLRLMALGLFIFGFGVSPLAVVQETIIVRFFKSRGLGVSMAFGLIAGKGASFLAARTSYPLTERFGAHAPFYVATFLAALSVVVNLIYIVSAKWLIDGAGAELEAPDITQEAQRRLSINLSEAQALKKVAERRKVHLRQIIKLGDVFWAYMCLNLFCGMIWSPFTHLAANVIQTRYKMSGEDAANSASYLLAGPLILYPMCGYLVDHSKHRHIVILLLLISSTLTMLAYFWFALPASFTKTPVPAIISFAVGHGFSPLLLVVLVPKIVPSKYISTALGAHKSMEQTGSTLFQTLAGILLDSKHPGRRGEIAAQYLLNTFLSLNILHFLSILLLACLQRARVLEATRSRPRVNSSQLDSPANSSNAIASSGMSRLSVNQETSLLKQYDNNCYSSTESQCTAPRPRPTQESRNRSALNRGILMAVASAALILTAWILFLTTAWLKLGQRKGIPH